MPERPGEQPVFCPRCGRQEPPGTPTCPDDREPLLPVGIDPDETGRILAGKYLLLERLGEGAFGAVYRARQMRTGAG